MAHVEQKEYITSVAKLFPTFFSNTNVLDVWSLDINGNNRYVFNNCTYTWLDIGHGNNVDIVCPIKNYCPGITYDVIISTEMLEHDKDYMASLIRMYGLLRPWWLLLVTCAGKGRPEHWTTRTSPNSSPYTNDYYKNIELSDIPYNREEMFSEYSITYRSYDLQFYWIKI